MGTWMASTPMMLVADPIGDITQAVGTLSDGR